MISRVLHFFICIYFVQIAVAQPKKVWSKLFGGDGTELCFGANKLNDSLFALIGNSNSVSLGTKGLTDGIIGIVNKKGTLRSLKTFGGPQLDQFNGIDLLPGGRLICVGQNNASGGDVPANYGLIDGFLLSYDPIANTKTWAKTFGGGNNDQISDVKYLEPGKIIFVGSTKSSNQDIPTNVGGSFDAFVSTIDEAGNLVRVKMFAGSKDDFAKRIAKINEGSFYVGGETTTNNDGAFLGLANKGKKDVFLFKLNRNSNQLSLFMVGGPGDDILVDMATTKDDGVVIVLNVNTAGGDIDSLVGGKDIFVMRFDNVGKLLWKKMIGGTKDDEAVAAKLNDVGELLITATSNSIDKDIKGNYGDKDVMLFKLNDNGMLISSTNYGGSRGEAAGSIVSDGTNTFLISSAFSTNNDLPSTNVGGDFWITNLFECSTSGTKDLVDLCFGDSINIHGTIFHAGNSNGRIVLSGAAQFGCDSIIDVELNLLQPTTGLIRDTFCHDATTTINNVLFDKNKTTHTFNLDNSLGCDSTLMVDLFFDPLIVVTDSMLKSDNGNFNGYVHITPGGGVPPYSFEWSNGSRTIDLDNVKFGTYTVTITDSINCVRAFSFIVKSSVNVLDSKKELIHVVQNSNEIIIQSDQELSSIALYSINSQKPLVANFRRQNEYVVSKIGLVSGVYFLELVTSDGKKAIRKIIMTSDH
ncbi:MAG: T9SS type A sorting domain-containing protein [Saprospiraceae bacterium]|nr:T9SS type A sorting domain-containing protein [Saprospiraceae bacterium]